MLCKTIIHTILLLILCPIIIAQNKKFDYRQIPYVKGECLIVIKDTNQVTGFKTLTIKQNSVLSIIHEKHKIDQIEEIHFKKKNQAKAQTMYSQNSIYKIKFQNAEADVLKLVSELRAISGIVQVEPNFIFRSLETIPNEYSDREELTASQWALNNIKAPEGWDFETGDTNVIITILDTGVEWDHPDLRNNIWRNSDEIPDNGLDDDENGFIDDYIGWDFVTATSELVAFGEDGAPQDNNPMDFIGHGTHVSGIAGAEANNQSGIAGLAWKCRIMPVRAGFQNTDGNGVLQYSDIIAGIYYAVDNGADIINMSFGESLIGTLDPESELFVILKGAIDYAYNHDVVLVASAGNDPIAGLNTYPAAFDEVISVAATTDANQKAAFSIFNSSWIDVAAPGVSILSTFKDGSYTKLSGTSMSAPFVSGLAALIKSQNINITNSDIYTVIKNSVDNPESDLFIGWGIINVQKALQSGTGPSAMSAITSQQFGYVAFLDSINIYGNISGDNYRLEYGEGFYPVNWTVIDSGNININGFITTWHISDISNGTYTLKLSVKKNDRIVYDRTTIKIKRPHYPLLKGWPVPTGEEIHSCVVVDDLDSDRKQEIIVYGSDGYLYVWKSDGTSKPRWPKFLGASRAETQAAGPKQNWLMGTVAIADIDNDGHNDIIIGSLDGKIYALDHEGKNLPGFPNYLGGIIYSSPTIFDLNHDGNLEVICRSRDQLNVISTNANQLPGWPQPLMSNGLPIWSNQAIGDLDNDGDYEIVVGSHYYYNSEHRDNKVYAYHHNGQLVNGWPVDLNPSGEYTGWVLSSPVVCDLDGNGTMEIIIGCDDNRLWVLNGDGTNFSTAWPKYLPFGFRSSPAVADLDHDGDLEIVIGHRSKSYPNLSLYALHHDGEMMQNWPYLSDGVGGFTFGWISPVIGDIDDDDTLDIISVREIGSFLGTGGGDIYAMDADANILNGFPVGFPEISYNSVTISDVDSDNDVDLLAGDLSGQVFIWDLPFHYDKEKNPWGQFRHDNWNTGLFGFKPVPPRPLVSDLTVCEEDSIQNLITAGENLQWYSDPELNNLVYTGNNYPTLNTQPGTNIFYVTQTVYSCKSQATKVTIVVSLVPPPPLCYDMTICAGRDNPELIASGDSIRWFGESDSSELLHSGTTFNTGMTRPGIYNYYVTQTTGKCESKADTVILTIKPCPPAPFTHDIVVCENQPVPELIADGENIRWYSDTSLVNLVDTGNLFASHQTLPGNYTYYASQTLSECESDAGTTVLTINPLPAISLGNDTTIYSDQNFTLGPFTDDYNYFWRDGSENPYFEISGSDLGVGNHKISVVVSDINNCNNSDTITVIVIPNSDLPVNQNNSRIRLFPNPTDGTFTIDMGRTYSNIDLWITELDGRLIQVKNFNNAKIINLRMDAELGIYLVTITTVNERMVFKVVKE